MIKPCCEYFVPLNLPIPNIIPASKDYDSYFSIYFDKFTFHGMRYLINFCLTCTIAFTSYDFEKELFKYNCIPQKYLTFVREGEHIC